MDWELHFYDGSCLNVTAETVRADPNGHYVFLNGKGDSTVVVAFVENGGVKFVAEEAVFTYTEDDDGDADSEATDPSASGY